MFQRIHAAQSMANLSPSLSEQLWSLYTEAFPINERREQSLYVELLGHAQFRPEAVLFEGKLLALLYWWQFGTCSFIEHFAVVKEFRGQGYGRRIISEYLNSANNEVVLEVELPTDRIGEQRIRFYQSLGFRLNEFEYSQLPMSKEGESVPMLLMSYPDLLSAEQFSAFKSSFRSTCFDPYLATYFPGI